MVLLFVFDWIFVVMNYHNSLQVHFMVKICHSEILNFNYQPIFIQKES